MNRQEQIERIIKSSIEIWKSIKVLWRLLEYKEEWNKGRIFMIRFDEVEYITVDDWKSKFEFNEENIFKFYYYIDYIEELRKIVYNECKRIELNKENDDYSVFNRMYIYMVLIFSNNSRQIENILEGCYYISYVWNYII